MIYFDRWHHPQIPKIRKLSQNEGKDPKILHRDEENI